MVFNLSLADKFLNSLRLEHLTDIKIAMLVRPKTMGRRKHADVHRAIGGICPTRQQVPLVVENANPSLELGDVHDPIAVNEDFSRLDKPIPFVEVLTFRREDLDAIVIAIANENPAVRLPYAVRTVELARTVARLAPREQQLSIGAELVHASVTVAVR